MQAAVFGKAVYEQAAGRPRIGRRESGYDRQKKSSITAATGTARGENKYDKE